jgi:predicted amidohydrolase
VPLELARRPTTSGEEAGAVAVFALPFASSARSTAPAGKTRGAIGEFYGQSYFCDPRGKILAEASRDTLNGWMIKC